MSCFDWCNLKVFGGCEYCFWWCECLVKLGSFGVCVGYVDERLFVVFGVGYWLWYWILK